MNTIQKNKSSTKVEPRPLDDGGDAELQGVKAARATHVDGYQAVEAKPVDRRDRSEELQAVPTAWELHQVAAGSLDPVVVAQGLRKGLLSADPVVVAKAIESLRIAESFQAQHRSHAEAFAGTGYDVQPWPGLVVELSPDEAKKVLKRAKESRYDGGAPAGDILGMLVKEGLLKASDGTHVSLFGVVQDLYRAYLPGSRAALLPRGDVADFQEAWRNNLEAAATIRKAVHDVAAYNTKAGKVKMGCPFSQGNHAKGSSFDGARLIADGNAPEWIQDLFAHAGPGRVRISSSATDPNEPDQKPHQTGFRLVIPIGGPLEDPNTPRIDLTANTGAKTHAESGLEHTRFTEQFSVPRKGVAGLQPVRIAQHLTSRKPLERISEIAVALGATKQAAKERFHEHDLYGRHSFFIGGRHVQVRFQIEGPTNFPDIRGHKDPNADLNAIKQGIAKGGLKVAMYLTEIPEGRPELVNDEDWKKAHWYRVGTVQVPAQEANPNSEAAQWFERTPHVPVGPNKLFWGEGIAADRALVYRESGKMRTDWKAQDGLGYGPPKPEVSPKGW